jgi:hypothetical protein
MSGASVLSLSMKSAVPLRTFSANSDRLNSSDYCHCLLAATFCAVVSLMSCGTPQTGPKLIEADGVRYTACGGAIWVKSDGNSKDPATITNEVLFKDAQGSNHHLTMLRSLNITDLPSDTPACSSATR